MRKKCILMRYMETQYDVLNIFITELGRCFRQRGYEVEIISDNEEWSIDRYDTEYSLILSFNGAMRREAVRQAVRDKNVPVWSFLVDHPLHLHNRLLEDSRYRVVSCVDRKHVEYVKKYYKNNQYVTFLPHGGIPLDGLKPFEEREHAVSFFGSYQAYSEQRTQFERYEGEFRHLLLNLADLLYYDYSLSMDEALLGLLSQYNLNLTETDMRNLMEELHFLDLYVRSKKRHDVIDTLLKAGIVVDVYGRGWENFETDYPQNLNLHGEKNFEDTLCIMRDSKIVLNVMPLFSDGSHERVFQSMCAKCICFTDKSLYLEECFADEKELFFYSMNDLEAFAERVMSVLNGEYDAEQILECAYSNVVENHLWQNRADEILAYMESLHQNDVNVVEEKNALDYDMNQLFRYLQDVDESVLREKMTASYYWYEKVIPQYIENLGKAFAAHPFWGEWSPEQNKFCVIDERALQLKRNSDKLIWVYSQLEDMASKSIFLNILFNWETLKPQYLDLAEYERYKKYLDCDILNLGQHEVFVNVGKSLEDTTKAFVLETRHQFDKIICYEPNEDNIDIDGKVTFIRMDAEGAEYDLLSEAKEIIRNAHPKLAIAVWYGSENIWRLAELVKEIDCSYHLYMRYYGGNLCPNEVVLYAI